MSLLKPAGAGAVMASRIEAPDSLDFFPTPPWATRSLFKHVLTDLPRSLIVADPCAGQGHMVGVLRELFDQVIASDVFDYGQGHLIGSFVGQGADVVELPAPIDWFFANPPFNLAFDFLMRALELARQGVALLLRTSWVETHDRYHDVFEKNAPAYIAQFSERVPMTKGRWNPDASTATAYAWFIWRKQRSNLCEFRWIPPGQRQALTLPTDRATYAAWSIGEAAPAPLFDFNQETSS